MGTALGRYPCPFLRLIWTCWTCYLTVRAAIIEIHVQGADLVLHCHDRVKPGATPLEDIPNLIRQGELKRGFDVVRESPSRDRDRDLAKNVAHPSPIFTRVGGGFAAEKAHRARGAEPETSMVSLRSGQTSSSVWAVLIACGSEQLAHELHRMVDAMWRLCVGAERRGHAHERDPTLPLVSTRPSSLVATSPAPSPSPAASRSSSVSQAQSRGLGLERALL